MTSDLGSLLPADTYSIADSSGEVRLFSVMRNEARRIPYFIRYYTARGVDRFFIVDNASTDETFEVLRSYDRVHVFHTSERYSESLCGTAWLQSLLDRYGVGHWCVVADADEFLIYPGSEDISIPTLCQYFDSEAASAFHCLLLDMYSDRPFVETDPEIGEDPLLVCPFFESNSILCVASLDGVRKSEWSHIGGMRRRLFELNVCLDKISLIKYRPGMTLYPGMHDISGATKSAIRGAVLHFKYLADFFTRAEAEATRGEHWDNASEYKRYAEVMNNTKRLSAYCRHSHRLRSSKDLIEGGIMKCPDKFLDYFSASLFGGSRMTVSQECTANIGRSAP